MPKLAVVPQTKFIQIPEPDMRFMSVDLVGLSPLLMHQWSVKAKREMADKHAGIMKPRLREIRDPQAEYEASMYQHPDGGYAFPAAAFRLATIAASRTVRGLTLVQARMLFVCPQDLVKIEGEPELDMRPARPKMGGADLRYRGIFRQWKTKLEIRYNAEVTTPEQIANLLVRAGECIGIGELRPEKGGNYGRFTLAQTKATPQSK